MILSEMEKTELINDSALLAGYVERGLLAPEALERLLRQAMRELNSYGIVAVVDPARCAWVRTPPNAVIVPVVDPWTRATGRTPPNAVMVAVVVPEISPARTTRPNAVIVTVVVPAICRLTRRRWKRR